MHGASEGANDVTKLAQELPNQVDALIIQSSNITMTPNEYWEHSSNVRGTNLEHPVWVEILSALSDPSIPDDRRLYQRTKADWQDLFVGDGTSELTRLENFEKPVLYLYGENDKHVHPSAPKIACEFSKRNNMPLDIIIFKDNFHVLSEKNRRLAKQLSKSWLFKNSISANDNYLHIKCDS